MYYTEVDSTLIDKCKEASVELEVWTVNSDTAIKALDPYVSGVTSDNLNASFLMYNADIN